MTAEPNEPPIESGQPANGEAAKAPQPNPQADAANPAPDEAKKPDAPPSEGSGLGHLPPTHPTGYMSWMERAEKAKKRISENGGPPQP